VAAAGIASARFRCPARRSKESAAKAGSPLLQTGRRRLDLTRADMEQRWNNGMQTSASKRNTDGDEWAGLHRRDEIAFEQMTPLYRGGVELTTAEQDRREWPLPISVRSTGMERLWSPAGATGGNRWQIERPRKRLKYADPQPVATRGNGSGAHGKEGVDGSSPSEGSAKAPHVGVLAFRSTCSSSIVRLVWSRSWSFRVDDFSGAATRRRFYA
jgi:hypothetical protein